MKRALRRLSQAALLTFLAVCSPRPPDAPALPEIAGVNGTVAFSESHGIITAHNELLELQWSASDGALIGIKSVASGAALLGGDLHASWSAAVDTSTDDPWGARAAPITPGQSHGLSRFVANVVDGGFRFDFVYEGSPVAVTQHVLLLAGAPVAQWTTDVTVDPAAHTTVIAIASPEILGVAQRPGEHLVWPWHEGVIFPDPGTTLQTMSYPAPASMQWQELYSDKDALYYAVLDATGSYKELRFGYDPALGRPEQPRQMSAVFYPFTTRTFTTPVVEVGVAPEGGWYWGADRYRAFLARSGMVRTLAPSVRTMRGWHKGYGKTKTKVFDYCAIPSRLMPADYTDRSGLSLLLMYGWHYDGLDSFYPDYDFLSKGAADPTCLGAADLAAAMGVLGSRPRPNRVMFYINGHIADLASDWMKDPAHAASAVRDADGNPIVETYDDLIQKARPFHVMCPSAPAWRAQLGARANALRKLGAAGIYWDQLEEMPSTLCYDRSHGHATPATAFPDGYKALFAQVHQDFSAGGTDTDYVFAAEGANDYYSQFIDVAGGMPGRTFGYAPTTCGDSLGWPCGGAVHAPEVGRYTMFAKFLGLANWGSKIGDHDEFARAFLMGDPLKTLETGAPGTNASDPYATTNPLVFPRYPNIYASEPDIYFAGRYVDARGLTLDAKREEVMGTIIVGANGDRLGLQLWNSTGVPRTVTVTIDLAALGLAASRPSAVVDLDGGAALGLADGPGVSLTVLVRAHDVKALKVAL